MTGQNTNNLSDAIRNLIVCDTQFGWTGETTLKLPELLDLQARGWLIEGDENCEFSLTDEGQAVVARALQQDAPAELAEQQGDAHSLAALAAQVGAFEYGDPESRYYDFSAEQLVQFAALAATGKQQVSEVMRSDLSGYAVAASQVRRGYDMECDRCGTFCDTGPGPCQQVGEVLGDAHVVVLREMRGRLTDAGSPARTAALDAAIAALAARQPGAQLHLPPDGYYKIVYDDAQVPDESFARTCALDAALRRFEQISARWNAHLFVRFANNTRDCTVPNAAPAQGIDLGPVAAMLRQARLHLQDGLNSQCMNKLDDLQTLIGQRDAAPGVSP
ncbi:hypothetical protein [Stenotrophomonas bentonitica]|uniref:hypothetical protein n=1 Tax=Stenotrophomonas bentonitica TaxID=1450134 RepID=UPI003BAA0A0E